MPNTRHDTPAQAAEKFACFNWMRGVAADKSISIIHRLVLIRLCLYREDKTGQCNPGYDAVRKELGVDRKTVMRAADAGIRRGWLAPPMRSRRANANFVFTFPVARDQEVRPKGTSRADQEVRPERDFLSNQEVPLSELRSPSGGIKKSLAKMQVAEDTGEFGTNGKRTEKRTGKKDSRASRSSETRSPEVASRGVKRERTSDEEKKEEKESKPAQTAAAFAEFWRAYPRRVAREAAARAFERALKGGAEPETLIAGARRYAVERAGQEPKYTKHPATWLNAGCWSDEPAGDVTIDQHGNVVAVEQPQPQGRDRGIVALAEELAREIEANGGGW